MATIKNEKTAFLKAFLQLKEYTEIMEEEVPEQNKKIEKKSSKHHRKHDSTKSKTQTEGYLLSLISKKKSNGSMKRNLKRKGVMNLLRKDYKNQRNRKKN